MCIRDRGKIGYLTTHTRDWLYVLDHATAIDKIYHEGRKGETYNIGGFNEWKNIDLIKILCKQMDIALENPAGTAERLITYVKDRPGHDLRYSLNSKKISKETGWKPNIKLNKGLDLTIKWYLENKNWWKSIRKNKYKGERLGI